MNTPEMPENHKVTQLAETFSTACEKAAAEGKAATYATPVVMVAEVVLIVPADANTERQVVAWWPV